MNKDGKKTDVLVLSISVGTEFKYFEVWADPGKKDILLKIPGIIQVNAVGNTEYHVFMDKRYELQPVVNAIIAALKPKEEHGN